MSKSKEYNEISIGEIVAADFRAAEIFKNAGIDFCCGGKKSLGKVCKEKSIDVSVVVKRLKELENVHVNQNQNFNDKALAL